MRGGRLHNIMYYMHVVKCRVVTEPCTQENSPRTHRTPLLFFLVNIPQFYSASLSLQNIPCNVVQINKSNHFISLHMFSGKMRMEDKTNLPRVRISVLGNVNVGKSGKFHEIIIYFSLKEILKF